MDQCTTIVRLEGWRKIVEACSARPEGMTVKQWLIENSIKEKAYYYWQRKVRRQAFDDAQAAVPAVRKEPGVSFAELRITHPEGGSEESFIQPGSFQPDAVIRTATATIILSNTVSDRGLSALLKEVRRVK